MMHGIRNDDAGDFTFIMMILMTVIKIELYLLICYHILNDSNFDTSNCYKQRFTVVCSHL